MSRRSFLLNAKSLSSSLLKLSVVHLNALIKFPFADFPFFSDPIAYFFLLIFRYTIYLCNFILDDFQFHI